MYGANHVSWWAGERHERSQEGYLVVVGWLEQLRGCHLALNHGLMAAGCSHGQLQCAG
jgi:hypothetical protein